jgi:hypothetical protein
MVLHDITLSIIYYNKKNNNYLPTRQLSPFALPLSAAAAPQRRSAQRPGDLCAARLSLDGSSEKAAKVVEASWKSMNI